MKRVILIILLLKYSSSYHRSQQKPDRRVNYNIAHFRKAPAILRTLEPIEEDGKLISIDEKEKNNTTPLVVKDLPPNKRKSGILEEKMKLGPKVIMKLYCEAPGTVFFIRDGDGVKRVKPNPSDKWHK